MLMSGDVADWEKGVHRSLRREEDEILNIVLRDFGNGTFRASDIIAKGYSKSHQSAQRWMNRLETSGLLEKSATGGWLYWSITRYGRWMKRALHKVFWVRWSIRSIDDPEVASKWPSGVKGWVTGRTVSSKGPERDLNIICARVEASDEADAKAKVLAMYGRFASEIGWSSVEEMPIGWWPPSDRFPP